MTSEINVYNLNDYTQYEIFCENQTRIVMKWDGTNPQLTTLMNNEYFLLKKNTEYVSSLWVDDFKKVNNWEPGKRMCLSAVKFGSSMILYQVKLVFLPFSYLVIDENGYLLFKKQNNDRIQEFERCNCLYNDLLDEENNGLYILK